MDAMTTQKTQPLLGLICVCGDLCDGAPDFHRLHMDEYALAFEQFMIPAEQSMAAWEAGAKARWSLTPEDNQ